MSQVQQLGKQTMRIVKNYTKGYTDTQTMVREATSSDPWGPSGTQMSEISQLTYNQQDFIEVMEMLDKRLNDKGKNWRHVFKSLTLLDYLLHAGSENVVLYFKENLYIVKTLREFVYVDDEGKDQGANVRQKAKEITALLMDDDRLRAARKGRASMRDRMEGYSPPPGPPSASSSTRPRSRTTGSRPTRNEDEDLRRAIEESKRMAEMEAGRHKDEDDMARAIRMSEEEEAKRKAQLAGNQNGLFDEQQRQQSQQNDQLIDFNSAPVQPQPTAMMPQFTGMPSQQFSSYNPFAAQQQAAQEEYMRMLEMQRQMEQQQQQAQYQQMMQQQYQQQQQQQQFLMAQQTAAQQPLQPQPTAFGSNNPFAAFSQPPQQPSFQQSTSPAPQQPSVPELPRPSSQPPPTAPAGQAFPKRKNENDERHAQLAAMLGSGGSGVDTYGNVGNLRVPMGSAFHPSNLQSQATGTNPFQRAQSLPPQQQQQSSNEQPFFQL